MESVELVGLVGSVVLAELAGLVASAVLAGSAGSAELAAGIARLRCRPVVAAAATGNTTRNTAVGLRIEIVRPRTDLEERRAVTRSPIARPMLDNRLDGRAAISLAIAEEELVQPIGLAVQELATELAVEEERIA